jgi:transposase
MCGTAFLLCFHRECSVSLERWAAIVNPAVVDGAMDGDKFDTYVRTQLAPTLEPGDVVIWDNLNLHKSPRAAATIAERKAWILFLPRYSPDNNPIEMAFSKLNKVLLRK